MIAKAILKHFSGWTAKLDQVDCWSLYLTAELKEPCFDSNGHIIISEGEKVQFLLRVDKSTNIGDLFSNELQLDFEKPHEEKRDKNTIIKWCKINTWASHKELMENNSRTKDQMSCSNVDIR